MAKGSVYGPERAFMRDPRSGLQIIRLTHHSSMSHNLYFEMCSFTEDEEHVLFLSERCAGRDTPRDLMRARTDGMELVQLTERQALGGIVVCPAVGAAFYQTDKELVRIDVMSLEEEAVGALPEAAGAAMPSLGAADAAGKQYFGTLVNKEDTGVLFKIDLETGESTVFTKEQRQNHLHVDPTGTTLFFNLQVDGIWTPHLINTDGSNMRPYPFRQFAHHTWLGSTGLMQGPLLPPGHAIVTFREGEDEPKVLTKGRYYWHSSASADAQWIVSDTNWPQEGLYLLHVPSGTVTYVCDPHASCSHPQWTHPHPSLSPNIKYVLFNSDMTGIGQIYLAELTEEFLTQAANGYACSVPNW